MQPSKLEKTVAGVKAFSKIAGAIVPAFQNEDMSKEVESLLKEHPIVAEYVKRNPFYRKTLEETAQDLYTKRYSKYITGAKLIDSADRVTGGLRSIGDIVGKEFGKIENIVELVPKALYSTWYANGTNDYAALPYFAIMEAASFLPVFGGFIDMSNVYLNRARKTFRKRVAEEFLRQVSPSKAESSKTVH
jgi:hypothetical protein